MQLDNIDNRQLMQVVDKLNSRPRKGLKLKTPDEAGQKSTGINFKKTNGCYIYSPEFRWVRINFWPIRPRRSSRK